jgi:VWFA-related protein
MTVRNALATLLCGVSLGATVILTAQQPTFRARVDHVTLDVVVTDQNETPVSGLTAKDFELTERDRPQVLADFSAVSIPVRPPIDPEAAPLPPRDVAMNAATTERSRAIVFLVTAVPAKNIVKTQRVLIKLFESLSPDDQAAVVFPRSSTFSQDFTNDLNRLVSAAEQMRFAIASAAPPRAANIKFAVDNVLHSLEAAKQPRKLVVWVGQGGVGGPDWLATFEKLRRAGIPSYPIDPIAQAVFMPPKFKEFEEPATFPDMAQNTGGHDYLVPGDPVATAGQLMAANGTYYLLGYYPDPFVRDNTFHDAVVRVPAHPDWHVRARAGYWARTDGTTLDATTSLKKELGAGLDDPGLPLRVFATAVTPSGKNLMRTLITTTVQYPPSKASSGLNDELRLGILAMDADGGVKAQQERVIPLKGSGSGAMTLIMDDAVDLPAKSLTVRVGVSSKALGTTGTAHLLLDVPDVRKREVTIGAVAVGFDTPGALVMNPAAIAGLVPFHPTAKREFVASDTIRVFSRVFWPGSETTTRVDAVVRIDSAVVKTVTLTGSREGDLASATLDMPVRLAGLQAGTHVLEVAAGAQGQTPRSTRQVVIDIR